MTNNINPDLHEIADVLGAMMDQVPERALLMAIHRLPTHKTNLLTAELKDVAKIRSQPKPEEERIQIEKAKEPAFPFKTEGRIPFKALQKAKDMIESYRDGGIRAVTMNVNNNFRSLNVGRDFRLFSRDKGASWVLMSHQSFSKEVTRL